MENITSTSRIDRAIVEKIEDIRLTFGDYSGLVLDFLVFISQRIKLDLFGYTNFTLRDFCAATGRSPFELCRKLPESYLKKHKPQVINGYCFDSVFDHLLIHLMKTNLLFEEAYETKENGRQLRIQSIRILSDVKLNFKRNSNEIKRYEIRLSKELLDGFIRRYYTIDSEAYKLAGKGKGGERKQLVVVYLSMLRHVLVSQNKNVTTIPCEAFSKYLGILENKKSYHQKEAINRALKSIRDKANFPFDYRFVSGGSGYRYFIEITFHPVYSRSTLVKEHHFYYNIIDDLHFYFIAKYKDLVSDDEEPFQAWLIAKDIDRNEKLSILKKNYEKHFSLKLSDHQSLTLYLQGFISK